MATSVSAVTLPIHRFVPKCKGCRLSFETGFAQNQGDGYCQFCHEEKGVGLYDLYIRFPDNRKST